MPVTAQLAVATARCVNHLDRSLREEETGDFRWALSLRAYVWLPSRDGATIRTTCRRCGGFIGHRPKEEK